MSGEKRFKNENDRRKLSEYEKGVTFVKFGDFSKTALLWHSPQAGYFVTDTGGLTLGGLERKLPQTTVELLAYASK